MEVIMNDLKTVSEIIGEKSNKSVTSFAKTLKYVEFYHPKARKMVKGYNKEQQEKILEFFKLSKQEKSKIICQLKYGVDNYSQLEEFRKELSDKAKNNFTQRNEKRKQTNLKKYGTNDFVNGEKATETKIKKYGSIKNYNKVMSELRKEKSKKDIIDFCKRNDCCEFSKTFNPYKYHSMEYLQSIMNKYNINLIIYKNIMFIKNSDCKIMLDEIKNNKISHSSSLEKEILDFVKSICNDTIIENDRDIISPKELDIYIPSKNIAIEFDGLFYHSELFLDKNYHLNKTKSCEEKGIRLIHVYEDEWLYKKDICKSIIASSLGVYDRKFYARKCTVEEISKNIFDDFLIKNHLQGKALCKYRYGLFYDNELIMVMGFGNARFDNKYNYELIRVCTKLNIQVVGGFSKLLNYFVKNSNAKNIVSYIVRRIFNGKGYTSSNFKIIGESKPSYQYCKNRQRFNRMNFQNKYLSEKLNHYDKSLTEHENLKNNGFYRIYDCGTLKVEFST